MKALDRYFMLKEMTENFENKNMMRHHFISHIKEAEAEAIESKRQEIRNEALEEAAKYCSEFNEGQSLTACELAINIRGLKTPQTIGGIKVKEDPTMKPGEWRLEKDVQ